MPENTILGNVTSDVISDQQFEYMRLISQIMQDRKRGDKPVAIYAPTAVSRMLLTVRELKVCLK